MVATSGDVLMENNTIETLKKITLSVVSLSSLRIPLRSEILERDEEIKDVDDMKRASCRYNPVGLPGRAGEGQPL